VTFFSVNGICLITEGDKKYVALDMMNEKLHYKAGDMFSFGITMYEMMSGEPLPLQGDHYNWLRHRTELSELVEMGYSLDLTALVLSLMNVDPTQRPTARDVLQFPALRVNPLTIALNHTSTTEMKEQLSTQQLSAVAFQLHQTRFEVAHYLMKATYRDLHNVYPPSVWRLRRGAQNVAFSSVAGSVADGTPLRTTLRHTSQSQPQSAFYHQYGTDPTLLSTPTANRRQE